MPPAVTTNAAEDALAGWLAGWLAGEDMVQRQRKPPLRRKLGLDQNARCSGWLDELRVNDSKTFSIKGACQKVRQWQ